MKAHPFSQLSNLVSLVMFCVLANLLLPTEVQADRLLGPPTSKSDRDGRRLGAPTLNNKDRPIQRGVIPTAKPKYTVPSAKPQYTVPAPPRRQVKSSEKKVTVIAEMPKRSARVAPVAKEVTTVDQSPKPVAIVNPAKSAKKERHVPVPEVRSTIEPVDHSLVDVRPSPVPTPTVVEKTERRITPSKNPSWQKLYRLGAGDVLNFSLYQRPELTRNDVVIAPDGSVSYLQAVSIPTEGRTIDQLKWAMEHSLSEYHKDPQVIITPAAIGSKQFSIIGRVREPGSYSLDRPTTVLEGMAMAQGIAVGTVEGEVNEIADMHHSFVARDGHKLDIDLSKLYHEGDFSQNALLEPDDYVYIASALNQEYYILGYVNDPGRKRMATKTTLARAVAEASGYEAGAWQKQVILVRGGIHHPETRGVDLRAIIKGKTPDVEIQSGDIIYVRERPTRLIEDAVDEAIFTFVQTATAEAINDEIGSGE